MKKSIITGLIVAMNIACFPVKAQFATQWRGEGRTGHFPSNGLLKEWPEKGPELLLKLDELPEAYSSVVLHEDVIYTTGIANEEEILTAINPDGTIRWSTVYGDAWGKSFPNARNTPTVEGNYAYMISGMGDLACIDIRDGTRWWSLDGYAKFQGRYGNWGVAESPLIVDNKMIYTPCGDLTTMVAVDKTNGSTLWMTESIGDQSAYTSPVLVERGEYKLIVTVTGNFVICVNAEDGEILWKLEYTAIDNPKSGGDINPVSPLAVGNEIFITSGYNHAGLMLQMSDDFRSVSLKWLTHDLDVHHGGVVYHEGYLYGANYTTVINGKWVCLDWETGALQYEHSWNGKGSIILSDGMLICYTEKRGHMALVEAKPDRFAIRSEFRIVPGSGPHWAHPSIFDGKLYVRHGKALMVYQIGD